MISLFKTYNSFIFMDDNEVARKLKMYLQLLPNQDTKILDNYSPREIYEHVEKMTRVGKKFINISRPIIEEMKDGWKKLLQF